MRLATKYEEIHAAGAEIAAVSVNDEVRQAGMAQRWKLPYTRMVSDPGGESILQPLGLFDPDERDGIALPGMIVMSPDGDEVYRYQGRDFADRTNDNDVLEAVAGLGLPAVTPDAWDPAIEVPDDLRGFFPPADLGAYFRGNMFGAIAIRSRLTDDASAAMAKEHQVMSKLTLDAWGIHNTGT